MPTRRISSAKGTPASACFNTATICSTLNRFCFTANLPFWSTRFCRKLTLVVDQKNTGADHESLGLCFLVLTILLRRGHSADQLQGVLNPGAGFVGQRGMDSI